MIAGYPIIHLVGRLIEGEIDILDALFMIGGYVGLVFALIVLPGTLTKMMIFAMLVGSVVLYPMIMAKVHRDSLHNYEVDKMLSYQRTLEQDPKNFAARLFLAESLYRQGQLDEAIRGMEEGLAMHPAASFQEKRKLEGWKEERRWRDEGIFFCPECHTEARRSQDACPNCGAQLKVWNVIAGLAKGETGKDIVRLWAKTMIGLTVMLFVLSLLPDVIRNTIIMAAIIGVAFYYYKRLE
ncbi:MAG: tetratricopeptide repeat protein [Armatimonadetes bacterium]|nr:tetratricopeptide repeat protein [Armatimonadota bacterium]